MIYGQSGKVISLVEYIPQRIPEDSIPESLGVALWEKYSSQITVDFPSPKTDGQWQLTSQGWVGFIPCAPELGISLKPKVNLQNLFRMLEYAYRLESFKFFQNLINCDSLEDFYENLAIVLAQRILDRGRKGFYRSYLSEIEVLPFIKGRINVRQAIQKPWRVKPQCHYEEHTSDIEENQILYWTLSRIAKSGICSERALPKVRRAYHSLRGFSSLLPFKPCDCVGRIYNRLNDDYKVLHSLSRFFLEHSGPSHELGNRNMIPFLVNMERLYELFVAEWLKAHLPSSVNLSIQEKVDIGNNESLSFKIDLVLYESETGKPLCVLDTKYKSKGYANTRDVAQVMAYAEMKNCNEAVLVYPVPLNFPDIRSDGRIHVKGLSFPLDGDLEVAGQSFLCDLTKNGIL